MRMGIAHLELAVMFDQVGGLCLSDDAQALGLLLLAFHTSEAFVRPGMVMATFYLRILNEEEVRIGEVLRDRKGEGRIKSYSEVREHFVKAIKETKQSLGALPYLSSLEEFMTDTREVSQESLGADLDLRAVRDAIAHHDFDIFEGDVRLRWVFHARGGNPGKKDIISVDNLDESLRNLRGLVISFFAWENMMMATCLPQDYPQDAEPSVMSDGLIDSLRTLKRIAWPFIR